MTAPGASAPPAPLDDRTLLYLRALSHQYPTLDCALAEIAQLRARLTLPKGTVHVVSDVHGEFKKLKHVINNASGSLRPLVEGVVGSRLSPAETQTLLNLIYYPREAWDALAPSLADPAEQRRFVRRTVRLEFELLRSLVRNLSLSHLESILPEAFRSLFRELLFAPDLGRSEAWTDALLEPFLTHGKDLDLLRSLAHVIRNLTVSELIVAGDLGDRGPRIDRVIDTLMRQPNVAITWGNHDVSWMGACLGHRALIATVARLSLRYRRLSQLEEGFGIPFAPLELLARTVYGEDPAKQFACKGTGLRDPLLMARMQKAISIIQFKLEGQVIRAHPEFGMEDRNLLHRIDRKAGTLALDGKTYPLLDTNLPTIDPAEPYRLTAEEEACMARLRQSFLQSPVLWEQMRFVQQRGAMYVVRDHHVIFHGCVPVDAEGNLLAMNVNGREVRGRELCDELGAVVRRAFLPPAPDPRDLDLFWYLWTGPLSPLFGKDRMATLETYLLADKNSHKETKNPYFKLIHDVAFCKKISSEFGTDPEAGILINGHVPVKVEQGESPLKDSGRAVTIDGAFSEAYGDKGFTLVLDAHRTFLARHYHFESVADAITKGSDIIPTIQDVRVFDRPRTVADTEAGEELRREIAGLELLIRAYRENLVAERR